LPATFAPIFLHQKIQSQAVTREKLSEALLNVKGSHKILMELTPGFCHTSSYKFLLEKRYPS